MIVDQAPHSRDVVIVDQAPRFVRSRSGLALGVLAALLLFVQLGAGSLPNSDDAFYAWSVRQAEREGSWLTYRWNGARLDFRYPPLHYMLLRASTTSLGHNERSLRLPAALAAFATLLALGLLVTRLTHSPPAGLLAALLLCASGIFFLSARSARTEATLAALSTATVLAYVAAWRKPRWLLAAGVAAGLAVLTKGVMGLIVLAPLAVDLLGPGHALRRDRHLLGGLTLFVVIAASWHVYQLVRWGRSFVDTYLLYNVLSRMKGITGLHTAEPLWRTVYASETLLLLVWIGGLIWAAARVRADRGARLLLTWAIAALLPLLLSSTRLTHYLVPALLPLSAAAGCALAPLLRRPLWAVLMPVAALGLFVGNNLATWLDPDFTPGLASLARQAHERATHWQRVHATAPPAQLVVYDDYHAAAEYYADMPTALVTDDARAYRLLRGPRAMREGARVEYVPTERMPARIAASHPVLWLTTVLFERRLAGYLNQLPPQRRARLELIREGPYLLCAERVGARQ